MVVAAQIIKGLGDEVIKDQVRTLEADLDERLRAVLPRPGQEYFHPLEDNIHPETIESIFNLYRDAGWSLNLGRDENSRRGLVIKYRI